VWGLGGKERQREGQRCWVCERETESERLIFLPLDPILCPLSLSISLKGEKEKRVCVCMCVGQHTHTHTPLNVLLPIFFHTFPLFLPFLLHFSIPHYTHTHTQARCSSPGRRGRSCLPSSTSPSTTSTSRCAHTSPKREFTCVLPQSTHTFPYLYVLHIIHFHTCTYM
jgi:hypothetical protein